ncbi:hypothetical protein VP395_15790 [Mariniflexile soesokkakense]|uniref:Lipoprotein n=1 Tax=Mariniflexile soesokkakense TaxID=1343160 RepID=A0ABV0ADQ0_9FLAO
MIDTKILIKKGIRLPIFCLLFFVFFGCSPKLNISELQNRINTHYTATNENNVEYFYKNIPTKYIKEYGEEGLRKKLHKMYVENKNEAFYDEIGQLAVMERHKCNSTYYYKTKYTVDKVEHTPYLDSIALKRNQKEYGIEHVNFNPNSKILQVRQKKESILLFDKKSKEWIFLDYDSDMKHLNKYFGNDFSDCLKTNNSNYINY